MCGSTPENLVEMDSSKLYQLIGFLWSRLCLGEHLNHFDLVFLSREGDWIFANMPSEFLAIRSVLARMYKQYRQSPEIAYVEDVDLKFALDYLYTLIEDIEAYPQVYEAVQEARQVLTEHRS